MANIRGIYLTCAQSLSILCIWCMFLFVQEEAIGKSSVEFRAEFETQIAALQSSLVEKDRIISEQLVLREGLEKSLNVNRSRCEKLLTDIHDAELKVAASRSEQARLTLLNKELLVQVQSRKATVAKRDPALNMPVAVAVTSASADAPPPSTVLPDNLEDLRPQLEAAREEIRNLRDEIDVLTEENMRLSDLLESSSTPLSGAPLQKSSEIYCIDTVQLSFMRFASNTFLLDFLCRRKYARSTREQGSAHSRLTFYAALTLFSLSHSCHAFLSLHFIDSFCRKILSGCFIRHQHHI